MADLEQQLYLMDTATLAFETRVRELVTLPDGRIGVILESSYFYPTSGGQEHDTGALGDARVVDVFKQGDSPVVVHVVDRPIGVGVVQAQIDAERRLRHMQHHTAQHLLTACFVRLFDLETLSANINGDTPSTLDLPARQLSAAQLEQAESMANQMIYEDRSVTARFVTPDELAGLPMRKPPKVSENIRIVEIAGLDVTPCGGTHVLSTGQIGVLRVLRTESINDRLRVHFAAGWQALEIFRLAHGALSALAGELSIHPAEVQAAVGRMVSQLRIATKELEQLRAERLAWEAMRLIQDSEPLTGDRRLIVRQFEGRSPQELRLLAVELRKQANLVAVLISSDGEKLSLVIACGAETNLSAKELLAGLLEPLDGRGGGDASLAQGGGRIPLLAGMRIGASEVRKVLHEKFVIH